ncbi:MAG: GNAT family N-acetyltransferase [Anaerovoracaceae bacterium]|jgi:ribosomal protein S18 acetylase RimI-like enzyme
MYEIQKKDFERLIALYLEAFADYPKLMEDFPDDADRQKALEAALRFYAAYDLCYGRGFALDRDLHEAALFVPSEEMRYTAERCRRAGCFSRAYERASRALTPALRQKREALFAEMDRLEADLPIPQPHLYVDLVGVQPRFQGRGRGRRLMRAVAAVAEKRKRPLMLFTNTEKDVAFYRSLGFRRLGETHSPRFGFTNVYLVRDAGA